MPSVLRWDLWLPSGTGQRKVTICINKWTWEAPLVFNGGHCSFTQCSITETFFNTCIYKHDLNKRSQCVCDKEGYDECDFIRWPLRSRASDLHQSSALWNPKTHDDVTHRAKDPWTLSDERLQVFYYEWKCWDFNTTLLHGHAHFLHTMVNFSSFFR